MPNFSLPMWDPVSTLDNIKLVIIDGKPMRGPSGGLGRLGGGVTAGSSIMGPSDDEAQQALERKVAQEAHIPTIGIDLRKASPSGFIWLVMPWMMQCYAHLRFISACRAPCPSGQFPVDPPLCIACPFVQATGQIPYHHPEPWLPRQIATGIILIGDLGLSESTRPPKPPYSLPSIVVGDATALAGPAFAPKGDEP